MGKIWSIHNNFYSRHSMVFPHSSYVEINLLECTTFLFYTPPPPKKKKKKKKKTVTHTQKFAMAVTRLTYAWWLVLWLNCMATIVLLVYEFHIFLMYDRLTINFNIKLLILYKRKLNRHKNKMLFKNGNIMKRVNVVLINTYPRLPRYLLYFRCKLGVTLAWRNRCRNRDMVTGARSINLLEQRDN